MHAVGKVRALQADLVLVDLHLPDFDGLVVTHILKRRMPSSLAVVVIDLPQGALRPEPRRTTVWAWRYGDRAPGRTTVPAPDLL